MRKLLPLFAFLTACYKTPQPPCAFLCGNGDSCPDGYSCSADDNRCHLKEAGGTLAACTDTLAPDAAAHIDSAPSPDSAPAPDAMPIDSTPAPDAYPTCVTALAPADDGTTAARQALVISEIRPGSGGFVELYNNTASDLDLTNTQAQLLSDGTAEAIGVAGAGITIKAHGQAVIPWPTVLTSPADAGGELVLYIDQTTNDPTHIGDFVCWGTAPATSLKSDAEANGKWTSGGACPGALAMHAIHRLPATTGLSAADYDVSAAPSPETCGP